MKIKFYNTIIREPDVKEDIINWIPSICTIYNHESHWNDLSEQQKSDFFYDLSHQK